MNVGAPSLDQESTARSTGLTQAEVADRQATARGNALPNRQGRTIAEIVRANVLTRFNAIIGLLALTVLIVGSPIDALFGIILVLNAVIGIVQELMAKRALDRLRVQLSPTVTVVRDGLDVVISPADVVCDDVIRLRAGDQLPADGVVIDADGLETDESALTGEADPVTKGLNDEVLAGSAVVAGSARVVVNRVGNEAWIQKLVLQARTYSPTHSELRNGVDRLLRVIGWTLVPLTALLLWSQLRADRSTKDSLVSAIAGVVGLVPQGLVLMISLAMATAVRRLAGDHVVVQELQAVEGLARIDVLCIDKTGTLTTGRTTLVALEPLGASSEELREALAALAKAEPSPTAAMLVIAPEVGEAPSWKATRQVAFSSARKWSATTFDGHGTWFVGAPEMLLATRSGPQVDAAMARVGALAAEAKRILLVAHADRAMVTEDSLPEDLCPMGLVVLAEQVRPDAAATLAYFAKQGVAVKVISGDNPTTVSAIAVQLGIQGAEEFADLRLSTASIDELAKSTTVFGRVSPEQKQEIVKALQRAGHVVAMTGDGVNDIPALKASDIGIAMDTATAATKAVAQLVLLDGRFDRLPGVVAEGRRVVANMERVSSLFVSKSIYAAVFALVIGISGAVFPFLPRHLSLVSELTVGIPAFALSFRQADARTQPGYLGRVLRFAVPAGLVAATVTLSTYWLVRRTFINGSLNEGRSASTLALGAVAFWLLYRLMRPVDRFDVALLGGLVALAAAIIATPAARRFYALDLLPITDALAAGGVTVVSVLVLEVLLRARHAQAMPG